MKTTNLKKLLLAGTAIVAVGGFAGVASAANSVSPDGTNTPSTALTVNIGVQTDAAADTGVFDLDGIANFGDADNDDGNIVIDIDHGTNTLYFIDSTSAAAQTTTVGDGVNDTAIDVATGLTGTIVIGEDSAAGNANDVNITFVDAITTTGTGVLNITTSANSTSTVRFQSATDLSATGVFTLGNAADTLALGEVNAGGDSTITFTGEVEGSGIVNFQGDDTDAVGHTIAGNVGTSTQSVAQVEVGLDNDDGAGNTDTHTINGDVYAANINFGAANNAGGTTIGGTLALDGNLADSTVNVGTVTTDVAGDGNLSIVPAGANNVTATVTGDIGTSTAAIRNIVVGLEANAGNATLDLDGNVYATAITIDEDSGGVDAVVTVTGTSPQTIQGTIDGQQAGEGDFVIGSGTGSENVTLTGVVGGTNDLHLVQVQTGATANISQNVTSGTGVADATAAIDINGTLNISAADNTVAVTSTEGTTDINGTVAVTGDNNVTIDGHNILEIDGTFSTNLTAAATLTLISDDNDIDIGEESDTTLTVGNQIITNSTAANFGATGRTNTLLINKTDAFDPDATAVIDADTNNTDFAVDTASTLRVGLATSTQEFDNNATITVIDGDAAVTAGAAGFDQLIADGDITFIDTIFVDIQDDSSDDNDLKIKLVNKSAANVIGDSYGGAAADELLSILNANTTGALQTIKGNLQGAATQQAAQDIAESIAPTVDGGSAAAGVSVGAETSSIVGTQLASLRDGSAETGMTAGNISNGLRGWIQGFGSTGEQDSRDGVKGFDIDTYGLTVGLDTSSIADRWIWGLAFSYADSEVDSNNTNNTKTEIDTYQFTLYGNYDLDEATYISGQLSYAFGDNDSRRENVGGVANLDATADYDSNQFGARIEAGRAYEAGTDATITPKVFANYVHYDADGYTETGAGTANLVVDQEELNIFELGLGATADWLIQQSNGAYLKPEIRLGVSYDLIGDEVETTSRFTGAGGSFKTKGFDSQNFSVDAGVGVTYFSTNNWDFTANYDFEYKEDYDAHTGTVRAAYKF